MITSLHPLTATIPDIALQSTLPIHTLPLAGEGTDFRLSIFWGLFAVALLSCVANYAFLAKFELSLQRLKSNRKYQIIRNGRMVAVYRFPPWQRVVWNLICKVGFVSLLYYLASAKSNGEIWGGALLSIVFICFNVKSVLREIFHPRSTFARRYLFFRADPQFIRVRLFYDFARRFVYFILGFTFFSYTLHRLNGEMFASTIQDIPLFLLHLQSNLSGMTSLGSDPLSYSNTFGMVFQILRGLFAIILVVTLGNIIISGLSSLPSVGNERDEPEPAIPDLSQYVSKNIEEDDNGLNTREDVAALVELVIERTLEIPSKQITMESDLIHDLGADSLDQVDLHLGLEQAFECGRIPSSDLMKKRKVADLVDFFWKKVQNEAAKNQQVKLKRKPRNAGLSRIGRI